MAPLTSPPPVGEPLDYVLPEYHSYGGGVLRGYTPTNGEMGEHAVTTGGNRQTSRDEPCLYCKNPGHFDYECNLLAEHLSQAANPDGPTIEGEVPPALRVIEALEQGHDNPERQNSSNRNTIVNATAAMEPPVIRIQIDSQTPMPVLPQGISSRNRQAAVQ